MSAFVCLVYIFHDFNFTGSQCQVLEFSNPLGKFSLRVWIVSTRWEAVCVCARERKKQKLTIPIKSPISLITRETHSSSYARSCHGDTSLKGHYYYCYWSARATDAMLWLRVRQRRNVLRLPFYSCSVRRGTKTAHADLPDTQTIDRQSWAYEGSRVEAASRPALVTMGGSRLELVKVETLFKIYCLPSVAASASVWSLWWHLSSLSSYPVNTGDIKTDRSPYSTTTNHVYQAQSYDSR